MKYGSDPYATLKEMMGPYRQFSDGSWEYFVGDGKDVCGRGRSKRGAKQSYRYWLKKWHLRWDRHLKLVAEAEMRAKQAAGPFDPRALDLLAIQNLIEKEAGLTKKNLAPENDRIRIGTERICGIK